MAFNNYGRQYQHIPDNYHLKPMSYAETTSVHSGQSDDYYKPVSPAPYTGGADLQRLETQDATLKNRIRQLRIVSRVLAVMISAATVAPLAMTLVKFFETRNQQLTVDGEQRTAWASGTVTWYTYMYFGVSTVSLVLNSAILIGYCRGVKKANSAASVAGIWSGIILVAHIIIWAASTALYRYGKQPVDGKFIDLWGWTCSKMADEIQTQVTNINYARYCTVQTSSFYTGIANTVTGILSASIYLLCILRMRSKKRVQQANFGRTQSTQSTEPLRY